MKYFSILLCLFLLGCTKSVTPDESTVLGIIPYADISKEKVNFVKEALEKYYHIKVVVLPVQPLPNAAFINVKSPRYRADSLIAMQSRHKPDTLDYILGLTEKDISVTKHGANGKVKSPEWKYADFGIMGLAYCPGKSAIVSDFRLKTNDRQLRLTRLRKVALHEMGHNFGLPHCPDKKCVMTDAVESIKTIDNANSSLCNVCAAKIK